MVLSRERQKVTPGWGRVFLKDLRHRASLVNLFATMLCQGSIAQEINPQTNSTTPASTLNNRFFCMVFSSVLAMT
jgi:hypothetical protein